MAGVFLCMQVALSAFGCPLPAAPSEVHTPVAGQALESTGTVTGLAADQPPDALADCHHPDHDGAPPDRTPCKAFCDADTQASGTREAAPDLHPALPLVVRTLVPPAPSGGAGIQAGALAGTPPPPATPLYLALLVLRN